MSNMRIQRLPIEFIGKGEVKGVKFQMAIRSDNYYIYKLTDEGNSYYELFEIRTTPLCVDFDNKIFSTIESKEVYPKSNDFGLWAWTFSQVEKALIKLQELEKNKQANKR